MDSVQQTHKTCKKCLRQLNIKENFYKSKRIDRYPDGHLDICKDCIRTFVKDSKYFCSFIWILEEVDVPFLYNEWMSLLKRYPDQYILGRYLAKMKLMGYKGYNFDDTLSFMEREISRGKDIFFSLDNIN